jgi:hypothetical protein
MLILGSLASGTQYKNFIGAMIFAKVTQGNLCIILYNAFSVVMKKPLVNIQV